MPRPEPLHLGDLRRRTAIDGDFGRGRGKPIDRRYIDRFLERHAADVRGHVLEVGSDDYTRRYGGDRVEAVDVIDADPSNRRATLAADLAQRDQLPERKFDCFICTQTLQFVYRMQDALANVHRLLKPGGVLLLTVPGISQISPKDRDDGGDYWRFTSQSAARLLEDAFPAGSIAVETYGNVLAAIGFLHGLACEDLSADELDDLDDRYPVIVAGRARRAEER